MAGGETEELDRDQDTNDPVDHTKSWDLILEINTSQTLAFFFLFGKELFLF